MVPWQFVELARERYLVGEAVWSVRVRKAVRPGADAEGSRVLDD